MNWSRMLSCDMCVPFTSTTATNSVRKDANMSATLWFTIRMFIVWLKNNPIWKVVILTGHNKMWGVRICGERRYWSVLITWLIRILSLFPAVCVCIQQFATLNPTLTLTLTWTLQWSLIRIPQEIRKLSPFRSVPHFIKLLQYLPHFVACRC